MHGVVVERCLRRDVCDICGKMFPNVVAFNDHVKKLHELQDYPCNQCDNKYKSANALQRHILQINYGTYKQILVLVIIHFHFKSCWEPPKS